MKRVTVQVDSERLESGEIVPIRITWQGAVVQWTTLRSRSTDRAGR